MTKRIICFILGLLLLLSVAGCGNNTNTPSGSSGSSSGPNKTSSGMSDKADTPGTESGDPSSDDNIVSEDDFTTPGTTIAVAATTSKTFTALPAEYSVLLNMNPDRGWRSEINFRIPGDLQQLRELTLESVKNTVSSTVRSAVLNEDITVTRLYFTLTNWRNSYDLPQEVVTAMDYYLQALYDMNVKAYLCIYYQQDAEGGATSATILHHIETVFAPMWEKWQDLIYAYDHTLIGRYGEWTAITPAITESAKAEIVEKVANLLPKSVYLIFRQPLHKATYLPKTHWRYAQSGFAQDAFFAKTFYKDDEGGNFRPETEWWQMAIRESPYSPNDGELFTTRWFKEDGGGHYVEGLESIQAMSELHHTTFSVNHGYGDFGNQVTMQETIMYGWKGTEVTTQILKDLGVLWTDEWFTSRQGGIIQRNVFEYIRDHLGYKLSAQQLSVTGGTGRGEKINISMSLKNYGFSAAFNLESGFAILDENNKVVSLAITGDPATWHPTDPANYSNRTQLTHSIAANMTLPSTPGTYKIAFFLRNKLGQNARLDNTVEFSDGYNILHMFTIE